VNRVKGIGNQGAGIIERVSNVLAWGAAVALLSILIFVVTEVVLRYVFKTSLTWTFELVEYLSGAVVFLGLAYTQALKGHIVVDVVVSRLGQKWQWILGTLSSVLGLALFSMVIWKGSELAWSSMQTGAVGTGAQLIPLYPAQFLVPLGSFVLCLQFLLDLCRYIGLLLNKGVKTDNLEKGS